jgi:hypothetical protein
MVALEAGVNMKSASNSGIQSAMRVTFYTAEPGVTDIRSWSHERVAVRRGSR